MIMGALYSKIEHGKAPYLTSQSNTSQKSNRSAYYYIAQKSSSEYKNADGVNISLSFTLDENILKNKANGIVYDKNLFEVITCGKESDLNFIRDKALRVLALDVIH